MALLNYSTSIEVKATIAEIQDILAKSGVSAIQTGYDGAGNIVELKFKVQTPAGEASFKLPIDPRPVMQIINEQTETVVRGRNRMNGRATSHRAVPLHFKDDMDQARRVAWRILKDWLEAQMAIVQVGMVQLHQVFLPYAIMKGGQTVFEMVEANGLLLEDKSKR